MKKNIDYSTLHEYFEAVTVPQGQYFFHKNDVGDYFFVMLKGLAQAVKDDGEVATSFLPG